MRECITFSNLYADFDEFLCKKASGAATKYDVTICPKTREISFNIYLFAHKDESSTYQHIRIRAFIICSESKIVIKKISNNGEQMIPERYKLAIDSSIYDAFNYLKANGIIKEKNGGKSNVT